MKANPQIDGAILDYLAAENGQWRKVAMVVIQVEKAINTTHRRIAGHEAIVDRIANLVESGKILSQGNMTNWRHSEVRIP